MHAPGEGSDSTEESIEAMAFTVSIHAPGEGSDVRKDPRTVEKQLFQSTLPVKGATIIVGVQCKQKLVSIHAPGEGSDICQG